jgi:hypothetical protein
MTKTDVKNCLIKRDGMTSTEANELIEETQSLITEVVESDDSDFNKMNELDSILADQLGLEPDCLMSFLG